MKDGQNYVSIESLAGLHQFSGYEVGETVVPRGYRSQYEEKAVAVYFVFDDVTYKAIEDYDDGYRSMLDRIEKTSLAISNNFPPHAVFCVTQKTGNFNFHDNEDVLLVCYDVKTAKPVLRLGTDYSSDDYYPDFIYEFTPENLAINQGSH